MTALSKVSLTEIFAAHPPPCLSLYQRTHRRQPGSDEDPIRFRNLVKQMGTSLVEIYPSNDAQALLKPFQALADDHDFWNHTLDGLVVLGAPDFFRVFRLPRPVAELVVVADNFHILPLWQFLQSVDRYQVLGLSLDKVRLFEGDRDALAEVELAAELQSAITEALGSEQTEPHQTVASYGGVGSASNVMHHGHGGKAAEVAIDANRLFRAVDRAVLEHHSRPASLPLILAALPEHHHRFREVSHNPFLVGEGITINPHTVSNEVLRLLAWKVVKPRYEARLAKLTSDFEQARANGHGSDSLTQIATAAASGRIATLILGGGRKSAGERIEGNALDDLGELVGRMGGEVLVIPKESMPTQTGAAAIYRY